jgi:hypothetical protein
MLSLDPVILLAYPLSLLTAMVTGFVWCVRLTKTRWWILASLVGAAYAPLPSVAGVIVYFVVSPIIPMPILLMLRKFGLSDLQASAIGNVITLSAAALVVLAIFIHLAKPYAPFYGRIGLALLLILPLVVFGMDQYLYDLSDPCAFAARGEGDCAPD